MELDFTTTLIYEDVQVFDFKKFETRNIEDFDRKEVKIMWKAVIMNDDFGIVSVFPSIKDIIIEIDYELEKPDEKGEIYQYYIKRLQFDDYDKDGDWKYEIEKGEPTSYGKESELKIKDVDIDFELKRITINF
tara:strand:- start:788 stop:1186 length:399 start_codon:yes stop_codon:yes gene_type:complete